MHVIFANTGKEMEETLQFVHECESRWQVPIVWVEFFRQYLPPYRGIARKTEAARARSLAGRSYEAANGRREPGYRVVNFASASRNGEPFDNLIDMVALPNVVSRLCTQEMKIRPIKKHMQSLGYTAWDNVVGIRADEPKRVVRMRTQKGNRYTNRLPLADAGTTKAEVLAYWKASPFDLQLPLDENGDTFGGNCDLCFLKGQAKRLKIAQAMPERVVWWAWQEFRTNSKFRLDRQPYDKLLQIAPEACQVDDDLGDCICHD